MYKVILIIFDSDLSHTFRRFEIVLLEVLEMSRYKGFSIIKSHINKEVSFQCNLKIKRVKPFDHSTIIYREMSTEYDSTVLNKGLTKDDFNSDPFLEFDKWFKLAKQSDESMPNGMSLATVSKDLQPSLRTVLLKYYDIDGFVFYTNYTSRKSKEIIGNPNVAMKFYWSTLDRQLIILGKAEKVSSLQSIKYFMSRPKESRIGAWCSNQSQVITSRSDLMDKFEVFKTKFKNMDVPKPQNWGGYRIIPSSFEFWQDGKFRLHDRFRYTLNDKQEWQLDRLAP